MLGQRRRRGRRRALGHDVHAATRAELDVTDADAVARAVVRGARPRRSSTAPPAPTSTAPRRDEDARRGGQRTRRRQRRGRGRARPARSIVHVSTDYVFDGVQARAVARVRRDRRPLGRLRPHEARRRAAPSPRPTPSTRSSARPGCSAPAAGTSSTRCSRSARERDEVSVVTDQVGCPTWTGHLAGALRRARRAPATSGIHHIAGAGSCSWNELALEHLRARRDATCRVLPDHERAVPAARPRPACSVLGTERARRRRACRRGRRALRRATSPRGCAA